MTSLPRASAWRLATRPLALPRRPLVMGIVNVTPDSFSDGGRHAGEDAAVAHGLMLAAEGADILDVGGESTRPFADPVDETEEWRRVGGVVRRLVRESGLPVSIDTSKASVAARAIDLGCEIVNDVTGLAGDSRMPAVAAAGRVGVCAMHMQGTPRTMQIDPRYDDVVEEIRGYLVARRDALVASGIAPEAICLDPGIGFGKTHAHNLELVRRAEAFVALGTPLLVGHSRKGFIGKSLTTALGRPATPSELDAGTAAISCTLAAKGVQIVRVHAVGTVRAAIEAFMASLPPPADPR
jgi:dihydropteroate synthase